MSAALLALSLCLGGVDDLNYKAFELIKIRIPTAWYHQRKAYFGVGRLVSKSSDVYTSPSQDAFLMVDVDAVKAEGMSGEDCRSEILGRLGVEGVELLKIDRAPAARWTTGDFIYQRGIFQVHTYIGCDGQTVWALHFHYMGSAAGRYEPLAELMGRSVKYFGNSAEVKSIRELENRMQKSVRDKKGG